MGKRKRARNAMPYRPAYLPPYTTGPPTNIPPTHSTGPTLPPSANAVLAPTVECPQLPGWNRSLDQANIAMSLHQQTHLCISVPPDSKEYQVISKYVEESSGGMLVVTRSGSGGGGIQRIVNPSMWRKFEATRRDLLLENSDDLDLLEKLGMSEKERIHRAQRAANHEDAMVALHASTSNAAHEGISDQDRNTAQLIADILQLSWMPSSSNRLQDLPHTRTIWRCCSMAPRFQIWT